jgi:cytochrome P450
MTTAETAWTEAMKYENRHDPYPFFDKLRETPVVQVAEKTYVVTGYQELLALIHDPRISSDLSRSPIAAGPAANVAATPAVSDLEADGHDVSLSCVRPAGPTGPAGK